ncbi:hypothetical protein [Rufibacter latericius]|uniref:Uncharacterized protein n=1 Tax=Rufibacter latericius TaxID=2487040 RepID=A0A3M9MU29_9BACT|nr:hypothetical protein [Rufibacter latericius]RNI28705.1 hypothetical protein EFB08_08715 [Rufibacter latericius]
MTETEPPVQGSRVSLEKLSDSCSYTLYDKLHTHVRVLGPERRFAQVNLDSVTDKGHPDSIFYSNSFEFRSSDNSLITIRFSKKYPKKELTKVAWFNAPENEKELYAVGEHRYAVDYNRFNTQNGIAIDIQNSTDGFLQSYLPGNRRYPTTLGLDYQNNSKFEITRFSKLRNGNYLLEARFSANLLSNVPTRYDWNAIASQRRVENGYLRMQLRVNQ